MSDDNKVPELPEGWFFRVKPVDSFGVVEVQLRIRRKYWSSYQDHMNIWPTEDPKADFNDWVLIAMEDLVRRSASRIAARQAYAAIGKLAGDYPPKTL